MHLIILNHRITVLIRDELEDLSFKVLNNEARELIKSRLDDITNFPIIHTQYNVNLVIF